MRTFVLVLGFMAMQTARPAAGQETSPEPTDDPPPGEDDPGLLGYFATNAEDPLLAEVLASVQEEQLDVTSSTEILYGSEYSDTIIYGDIIRYSNLLGCGWGYDRIGRGMCVFAFANNYSVRYRGTFRWVDTWSPSTTNPLGIGGDPWDGPTWGSDYIFPSDLFGDSYLLCGTVSGATYYVSMDAPFDGTGTCGDVTAAFPTDSEMEIRGDGTSEDGDGEDHIWGWDNHDVLTGDGGDDELVGGGGADSISGDNGDDYIDAGTCTSGTEWLYGGFNDAGVDWIVGMNNTACQKRFYGGDGPDVLRGSPQGDYMSGGDGGDIICGGQGSNTLYGGGGNDGLFATSTSYCDGGLPTTSPGDTCSVSCNPSYSCETSGGSCPY